MLTPPPVNWVDVTFDSAAARHAAAECDRFVGLIEEVIDWNHDANVDLQTTWQGGLAMEFEAAVDRVARNLRARAAELRIRAIALRDAADAADDEQHRRERQRDDWHDWDASRRRLQTAGVS